MMSVVLTLSGASAGVQAANPPSYAAFFTNLFSFNGTNGYNPSAPLVEATPGSFYGTTIYGGTNTNSYGTIFHLSADGSFSNVLSFNLTNGAAPKSGVILGSDGNLYGTTTQGGASAATDPNGVGFGTTFKLTTNGVLTTVASFDGTNARSANSLTQLGNGLFYGTSAYGGNQPSGPGVGQGDIFSFNTNGTVTPLYAFNGSPDGLNPGNGLTLASNNLFYGTTTYGGNSGLGGIFSYSTTGAYVFYDVFNGTNGNTPNRLVLAADGSFYGTTSFGGGSNFYGTLFRFLPNGVLQDIFHFNNTNGKYPNSLMLAKDGNFYGTTSQGGAYNGGTLFQLTTNNVLTTLYQFTAGADGYSPMSLVQGQDGNLYGTTSYGGTSGRGTLFRLAVVPAPTLAATAGTNSTFMFSWNAFPGHTYEVQYKNSLTSGSWVNLQAVTATNTVATYKDTSATVAQRYYRLLLLN